MRIFAKRIHDEGFCFLRDLLMVATDFCKHGIPLYLLQEKIKQIVFSRGLELKMFELVEQNYNFESEIKDYYPYDQQEKMDYASDILSLMEVCPNGIPSLIEVDKLFKRLQLTRSEKKSLMVRFFFVKGTIPEIADFQAESLLNDIMG